MSEKKFDVLKEVENQYEESKNEDCQHCGIKDPRQSNRNCKGCGRIHPDTGKWYWYGSDCYMFDEPDDPATLAAEIEEQVDYIDGLLEDLHWYYENDTRLLLAMHECTDEDEVEYDWAYNERHENYKEMAYVRYQLDYFNFH